MKTRKEKKRSVNIYLQNQKVTNRAISYRLDN